jgi:hypothetical protein
MNDTKSLDTKSIDNISTTTTENLKTQIMGKWSEADEELLKEWADHSICYKWLHEHSYKKYDKVYSKINIPIIILSTITGTANFAQGQINDEVIRNYVSMIIGFFSIFAGVLATLISFFKIGERKEKHNSCAKLWDKLHRNIQVEMVKPPSERLPKKNMMDMTKKEYDRLIDDSPMIPDEIISLFETTFKKDEQYKNITKPNILNVFQSIKINHIEEIIPIEKNTDIDSIKIIEARFKQVNGRPPTEIELQNIIDNNIMNFQIP